MQRDLALISYKKINHKSSSSNSDMSLPFTFPSDSNNFLKPKSKNCLNLSADRRPPEINTHIVSPRNQPNFIITPKDFCEKAPIDVRPHTTKYSQKHFDLENKAKKDWEDIKVPINPSAVVKMFSNKLTDFEKVEIVKYTNIYFIGNGSKPNLKEFDDESGDYVVYIHDHIHYRYEIISVLGKGSFGQVIEVYDHATTKTLAMKIIKNHRDFYEQAQVEISMLKSLKENDRDASSNIVHYEENFVFRNHICITFELLSINLYDLLKKNQFKGLSSTLIKRFSIQILQALSLLSKLQIIHCDLKPENILLVHISRSSIKVIDFGSSSYENRQIFTYIQSRFYRAPEVILGIPITTAIDVWSFGCILAELFTGTPLFPGEDEKELLMCMMEVLGPPPVDMVQIASKRDSYFDKQYKPKEMVNSRGRKRYPNSKDLRTKLVGADDGLVMLIEQCLQWNPKFRITPQRALENSWLYEGNRLPSKIRYKSAVRSSSNILK